MRAFSTATILLAAAFAGCVSPADGDTQADVLASFYPLAYVTSRIAGDAVSVASLVPNGTEPHDWDASSRDLLRLATAQLLIAEGDGFEPWLTNIAATLGDAAPQVIELNANAGPGQYPDAIEIARRGVKVACADSAVANTTQRALSPDARCRAIDTSSHDTTNITLNITRAGTYALGVDAIDASFTLLDGTGRAIGPSAEVRAANTSALARIYALDAGKHVIVLGSARDTLTRVVSFPAPRPTPAPEDRDPHTWLDPVAFAAQARVIADALVTRFPEYAATFTANLDTLLVDFNALDSAYAGGLALCETRTIVTSHNAFAHLAARYGFEVLAIAGLSPEAEPDARTVARVVEAARALNVRIVFFEDLVDPRVAQVLADEIGADTRLLSPLEGLTPRMKAEGADYVSVMRENLANLRDAMRCT